MVMRKFSLKLKQRKKRMDPALKYINTSNQKYYSGVKVRNPNIMDKRSDRVKDHQEIIVIDHDDDEQEQDQAVEQEQDQEDQSTGKFHTFLENCMRFEQFSFLPSSVSDATTTTITISRRQNYHGKNVVKVNEPKHPRITLSDGYTYSMCLPFIKLRQVHTLNDFRRFCSSVSVHSHIVQVDFSGISMNTERMNSICMMIRETQSLRKLFLNSTNMTDQLLIPLINSIKLSKKSKYGSLSRSEFVSQSPRIEVLGLYDNAITSQGLMKMIEYIPWVSVDLRRNNLNGVFFLLIYNWAYMRTFDPSVIYDLSLNDALISQCKSLQHVVCTREVVFPSMWVGTCTNDQKLVQQYVDERSGVSCEKLCRKLIPHSLVRKNGCAPLCKSKLPHEEALLQPNEIELYNGRVFSLPVNDCVLDMRNINLEIDLKNIFERMSQCTNVKHVYWTRSALIGRNMLDRCRVVNHVTTLHLDIHVSPEHLKVILDKFPNLNTLSFGKMLDSEHMQVLGTCFGTSQSKLEKMYLKLQDETVSLERFCESMLQNKSLILLSITDSGLQSSHVQSITSLLRVNHSIRSLSLSGNDIGSHGTSILFDTIKRFNRTISILDLSNNRLGGESAVVIANGIQECKSLNSIDLSNNLLCDSYDVAVRRKHNGTSLFSHALVQNKHLLYLDLSYNAMTQSMFDELLSVLNKNDVLHTLIVKHMPPEPCITFSENSKLNLRRTNCSLACIYISRDGINCLS